MNFKELSTWVEAHPGESILIGGGGLIALLWLLGYFSPSASAPAQDPLAAAYYAAEAQQAVVGGQIQQATISAARDTAIAGIQANAATAINAAQVGGATTINGQNATAATTINSDQVNGAVAISGTANNDQLQATYSNNATALATTQSNNETNAAINANNNLTGYWNNFINSVVAPELLSPAGQAQGQFEAATPYGKFSGDITGQIGDVNVLKSMGLTDAQIAYRTGYPIP